MYKFTVLLILLAGALAINLQSGHIYITTNTLEVEQHFKVDLKSSLKSSLNLSQSSKIKLEAKIQFSRPTFKPQFFSFRLRHPLYDNLTEPVLAHFNEEEQSFIAIIDIGDPKQIHHMNGDYGLQMIIADEQLTQNVRKYIANCKINFRFSLESPLPHELSYQAPGIILTDPPTERIDPPATFTFFIVVAIIMLFLVFVWGLSHLKVNLGLFPVGSGSLMNFLFLGVLGVIFGILIKFWINWTFIETMQWILLIMLPTAFIANYAFLSIKNE